jgi:4-amino-4-deoxy-L-arabinose transferase-like glycosyltransferase
MIFMLAYRSFVWPKQVDPMISSVNTDGKTSISRGLRRPELWGPGLVRVILGAVSRHWGIAAILLVALVVRCYGLTYHSLWFDEVMSAFWAAKPAGEIWRAGLALVQDKHPPLYYLALHFWTALFGPGDVAVRSLGVLIGALAVLPAYGIGKIFGGRRAAAAGALLIALNPFLVWYSQEARMFMPATTCALAGLWGILQITNSKLQIADRRRLLFAICNLFIAIAGLTAALYTYLFSAFLLPVAAAWVMWEWRRNRRQAGAGGRLALGMAALAVVTLLFLPLARAAWQVSGGEATPGQPFMAMAPALWRMLWVYAVGWPGWPALGLTAVGIGAVGLLGVGVLAPSSGPAPTAGEGVRFNLGAATHAEPVEAACGVPFDRLRARLAPEMKRTRGEAAAASPSLAGKGAKGIGSWLFLPLLLGGLLLARDRTVFAETRYFIFLVPALCLAWGRGTAWLWEKQRAAGIVLAALALGVTLAALPTNWSPQNRREAWREMAAFVQAHAGFNDAILIQPDYVRPAFDRYFGGAQPVFQPFTERLSSPAQVEGPLAGLAGFSTVWLIQSHHQDLDPDNLVVNWLAARYPLATEVFPAGIAARAYALRYRQPVPSPAPGCSACGQSAATQEDAGMLLASEQLRLMACTYQPATLAARDDVFHPPSNWIHVVTQWQVGNQLPREDLLPKARLVDAGGQVWGERLDRANDALHLWATSRWQPGEVVRVDYDVNLNPMTPPGRYRLAIELPGEQAVCGAVMITR